MSHYKLTYFNSRGLAEVSRQLFHLANVEYEDHRLTQEEFELLKPELPTGQVPILYIDGVIFHQSTAIGRFLARKFGYSGKTAEEELLCDQIVDTFKDFIVSFRQLAEALLSKKSEIEVKTLREDVVNPAANLFFSYISKILGKSSKFLVGSSLTWADLVVADSLTTCLNTGILEEPSEDVRIQKLLEFRQGILKTPGLVDYFEKRPKTLL